MLCLILMYSSLKVEREKERRGSDDDDDDDDKFTELQRNEDEKIRLDGLKMAPKKEVKLEKSGLFKKPAEPTKKSGGKSESSGEKRKMSALEEIMKEEEERKKKQASFLLKKKFGATHSSRPQLSQLDNFLYQLNRHFSLMFSNLTKSVNLT